jgi:transcriptional regulator with XRE-family HTH domain
VANAAYYRALSAEIIRLLVNERKGRRLSNYAISKKSGVSQSMLSLVERGLRVPTMETVLRMADGIGADFPALIKRARAVVEKKQTSSFRKNEG